MNKEEQYTQPTLVSAQPVPTQTYTAVGTIAAPPGVAYTSNPYASQPGYVQQPAYGAQPAYVTAGQPAYVVGGAQPVSAQPMYVQPNGNAATIQRQRPVGRWGDNICDWPTNLYPSCYCSCCVCCGMWIVAQMAQKTGCSTFRNIAWGWLICGIVGFILALVLGSGNWIYIIPLIYMLITQIVLRIHIAKRDNITEMGGCFGECCVGFWCMSCSISQMARHLYGYNKVLDGDGDPDRPDQYAPPMQV